MSSISAVCHFRGLCVGIPYYDSLGECVVDVSVSLVRRTCKRWVRTWIGYKISIANGETYACYEVYL
jgi:hypothetical protein